MSKLMEALKSVEAIFDDTLATKLAVLETEVKVVDAITPADESRWQLIAALAQMPDEAFGWLAGSMMGHGAGAQVWPDGLGGFMPASRAAIEEARTQARAWLEQQR